MKLTESTNICHFSDRFAGTIKINMFTASDYLVNGLQSENKIPII